MSGEASHRTIKMLVVLVLLNVVNVTRIGAQPGDPRTPEEIRQQLNARLDQAHEQIRNYPEHFSNYHFRGEIYVELSARATDEVEKSFYSDKALADFTKAIELEPNHWKAYVDRAQLKSGAGLLNKFDDIRSDYLTAVRIIQKDLAEAKAHSYYVGDYSPTVPELYQRLSNLYLNRAEALISKPNLITELNLDLKDYSSWDDFDKGIAYAQNTLGEAHHHLWNVINALLRKGDMAYKQRDYKLALATYQRDGEYVGKDYALVCEKALSQEWCDSQRREILLKFAIRRGRAYLRLGRADDALKELNIYFDNAPHLECQDIFLLRAQAHWALGNDELATADEQSAKKKSSAFCAYDIQKE